MERREIAEANFENGYNCSQAVVLAFSDMVNVEPEILAKLASSFGGGMGRLREVCGAVSGMFMVIGLLFGYENETGEVKAEHYERVQELARQFEKETGSIVCRDLLGISVKKESPIPEERTPEYYKKRPCKELVGIATEILENFIKTQ